MTEKNKSETEKKTPEKKTVKKKTSTTKRRSTQETKTVLKEKLIAAEAEVATLKDHLLRTAAELDNFKKRTERESVQLVKSANSRLIQDLLPVIDDFERSFDPDHAEMSPEDFRHGMELVRKKLLSVMERAGLEPMEALNQPFDVERHDALLQVEKEGVESGIVVDEHLKGYILNGNVLRHAQVVVSK